MAFLEKIPLTRKVLIISILICTGVWAVLDKAQTIRLQTLFNQQLNSNLQEKAAEDRAFLDSYIRSFGRASRLIGSQKKLNDYLSSGQWDSTREEALIHERTAPWLPGISVIRSLPFSQYFLLLNPQGQVKEICRTIPGKLPESVSKPDFLLRQLSHSQTYLTQLGNFPYLATSQMISSDTGELLATLMLITPLDNLFLKLSLTPLRRNSLIAMVDSNKNRIIASNKPDIIKPGTNEKQLSDKYLITGKSYFDYGSSDLQAHFISLLPQHQYAQISKEILKNDRTNRAITSVSLIFCLLVIITFITHKINKLKLEIDSFASQHLNAKPYVTNDQKDQLSILQERFRELKIEILKSQEKLKTEANKNISLTKQNMEMEEKQLLFELLKAVTDRYEIGVIIQEGTIYLPANNKMEHFSALYTGIETFTKLTAEMEHILHDTEGKKHIFQINEQVFGGFEAPVILVQEITSRKNAEEKQIQLIDELQNALGKVKLLSGFLPICAKCKKIRDDQGYWNQIEMYLRNHSEAEFSHSICPDCFTDLYGHLKINLDK